MSADELHKVEDLLKHISKLLKYVRIIFGVLFLVGGATVTAAVWVRSTSATLAENKEHLASVEKDNAVAHKDFNDWRHAQDVQDARITLILENQQKQLDQLQAMLAEHMRSK